MKIIISALVLGPLMLSACASNGEPQQPEPDRNARKARMSSGSSGSSGPITSIRPASLLFASFNRNDDYSIDQKEFADGIQKSFEIADNNKDDKLTPFELEIWRKNALGSIDAAPGSMMLDTDFNQLVTHAEFDAALGKLYQASDRDGNGAVSFDELVKIISRPSPRQNRSGGKPNGKRPSGGKGGGKGSGRGRGG